MYDYRKLSEELLEKNAKIEKNEIVNSKLFNVVSSILPIWSSVSKRYSFLKRLVVMITNHHLINTINVIGTSYKQF